MKLIYKVILVASSLIGGSSFVQSQEKIPVFIFTDININSGDPDDRQSLIHLLWYSDQLDIKGIVPERWNARSIEACKLAIDSYAQDYYEYNFMRWPFPNPTEINEVIAQNPERA